MNVGGGLAAIFHTRISPRLGPIRALLLFWTASLPFALAGAFAPTAAVAVVALVGRGILMTAAKPSLDALRMSSFAPRERGAAQALSTTSWSLANGAGALVSGAVRSALGAEGYTVNIVTLVVAYALAALAFALAFRRR